MILRKFVVIAGILLLTMPLLKADDSVLNWIEGKGASSAKDPCTAAFSGTKSHPKLSNVCYYCPHEGTLATDPSTNPKCSIAGTPLNACKVGTAARPAGILDQKDNICISCLPGKKYNGYDCD